MSNTMPNNKIDVLILPINDFHDVVLYEYNAQ